MSESHVQNNREIHRISLFQKKTREVLLRSNQESVHVHAFIEVRLDDFTQWRRSAGISLIAGFAAATVAALQIYPEFNNHEVEEMIVVNPSVNLGVVVDINGRLMVPNVKNCENMSIGDLSKAIENMMAAARTQSLNLEDFCCGTFTINNLGALGVDGFTSILNPPETGMLNIGTVRRRPVVDEASGQIVASSTVFVGMAINHNIVNGSSAARFLSVVKDRLEAPNEWFIR